MRRAPIILARFLRVWALASLTAATARAVEVAPVYSLSLLGGQDFYGGKRGTLTGNFSALAAPGVRFNERWELYPSLSSNYRATRQVVELVSGGTLFEEQMEHRVAVKPVYSAGGRRWKLKPSLAYRMQFLKETKDESWGSGLFDTRRTDLGLEGEYLYRDPFSVRLGFGYVMTRFPNYTSLESKAATDFQGKSLARELAGDKILDSDGQMLTLAASAPIGGAAWEWGYTFLRQNYGYQHLVDAAGSLTPSLREDFIHILEFGVRRPLQASWAQKIALSFDLGYTANASSQNNYDALRTRFLADFYDYEEFRAGPGLKLQTGDPDRPTSWGAGLTFWRRNYPNRPIQSATGLYQTETLHTDNWAVSVSASRPIAPRFKLIFNLQHGRATSNQKFEQYFKYTYNATNYLFGMSYDY